MGRKYAAIGAAAVGTNVTILTLISATTIRPKLYQVLIGCSATPADQATRFYIGRVTGAGTAAGNFTPMAMDPADPASLATAGQGTFSGEPTYTSNAQQAQISMNQRATVSWVANQGYEIICPATGSNGVGLRSSAATGTAVHDASIWWDE